MLYFFCLPNSLRLGGDDVFILVHWTMSLGSLGDFLQLPHDIINSSDWKHRQCFGRQHHRYHFSQPKKGGMHFAILSLVGSTQDAIANGQKCHVILASGGEAVKLPIPRAMEMWAFV